MRQFVLNPPETLTEDVYPESNCVLPMRTAYLPTLLIVIGGLAVGLVQAGGLEILAFTGEYDLRLSHVHSTETIQCRFDSEGEMIASERLSPILGLVNISFIAGERPMAWTYDGQCLEWTYEPPLESGQTILYTREWDQVVTPDSSGLRDVLITAAPTSNASIVFATKDVDIISSSLPLGSALDYHGNLSNPPYGIRYSSRFKLYNLTWFCGVENLGSDSSDIALDISVPCNTEFQHTIIEPEGDFTVDDLGNRRLILNMVLPPRACINITLEFSILVQTWPEGWGFASGRIDPERFLGSDPRFWQLDDPRIRAFASQAVAGMTDAREMAMALAEAISDHLTYSQIPERKGALWALLNRMGSCREYADLLIACARCQGIPALYVSGLSGSSANDSAGHAWIALWLEGIGWVGLDPGWGYTGLLDSARIVTGFCDPEDVDMLLTYKGGNTTIPYWTIDWSFEEVETARANAILGVADVTGLQTWTTLVGLAFLRESQRRIGASVEG